jgi:hypothetical protein
MELFSVGASRLSGNQYRSLTVIGDVCFFLVAVQNRLHRRSQIVILGSQVSTTIESFLLQKPFPCSGREKVSMHRPG